MRIITDEYDKNQIEMDNVIIESDNESSPWTFLHIYFSHYYNLY